MGKENFQTKLKAKTKVRLACVFGLEKNQPKKTALLPMQDTYLVRLP